jgi:P-type E1-E2 ATPase
MGNEKLFRQHKILIPDTALQRATELCQQAQLVVFVAWQDRFWGLIGLEDQIRDAAEDVVGRLRQRGLKVIMVTGDNSKTANTIGKKLGIDEIVSEVLPADKQQVIENMQAAGHVVAMVGDGINDAPALATADLGVAVGSGADVSIEAADIVLTRDRLADVDRAIHLSRATLRTIRQNLVWAFVYNATLLPIAAGLIPGISLQPAWAAAAMACSSISVVTNSLMLRWR